MLTLSLRKKKKLLEQTNKSYRKHAYIKGVTPQKNEIEAHPKVDGQHKKPLQIPSHTLASSFRRLAGQSPQHVSSAGAGQEDEELADPLLTEAFQHPLRLAES